MLDLTKKAFRQKAKARNDNSGESNAPDFPRSRLRFYVFCAMRPCHPDRRKRRSEPLDGRSRPELPRAKCRFHDEAALLFQRSQPWC